MHPSDFPPSAPALAPTDSLQLIHVACAICGADDPEPVAVGEDFDRHTSDDTFLMVRCRACGLLYLNPRPASAVTERIDSTAEGDPVAFTQRLLRACRGLRPGARILDVGCKDGARLRRLRASAPAGYRLEGIESDPGAVATARALGLTVYHGTLAETTLEAGSYDLAFALETIGHSADPGALLAELRRVLRPGGSLIVITENADSFGRRVFGDRYYGGYHFPRNWNLFARATLSLLAADNGLHVKSVETCASPQTWQSSLRNAALDLAAPAWLVRRFGRNARASLWLFSVIDAIARYAGGGSLLYVELVRPAC